MAIKPLSIINIESIKEDPKNPKSATKEIKQLPVERNGFLWLEAQPNKGNWEGKYGFDADTYKLELSWATGYIDTTGHKWLIGSFKNWEELVEIKWSCKGGIKSDGKNEWLDHADLEGIKAKWTEQGNLMAVLVDDVPQLVMLVEAIVGKHVVFNDGGYTVFRKLNPDKATFEKVLEDIISEESFDYQPSKRGSNPKTELHKKYLEDNSWFYMCFTVEDLHDVEFPGEGSPVHVVLNDDGLIEKVSVDWQAPEIKEKGKWSGGGGAKGQSEKDILAERLGFVTEQLGVSSIDEMLQRYPTKRSKLEIVMSIACGTSWVDRDTDLLDELLGKETHANGHNKAVSISTPPTSLPSKPVEPKPSVTTQPTATQSTDTEQVSTTTTLADNLGEIYIAKILQLNESGSHKLPKEVDVNYLNQQGNSWCQQFYAVLQGTINDRTPYGKDTRLARAVSSFVMQQFNKQLWQLDAVELIELQQMPEFKGAIDIDKLPM